MNKKEVLEIRKLFTKEDSSLQRICGCYVDGEKNKVYCKKDAFLSLPQDEMLKYNELLKGSLAGSVGKTLINMEFPIEQERDGGTQYFLEKLRKAELKDDVLLDEFYNRVIANLNFDGNYYIILVYGAYDVPGKASDGTEMYDASDEVYSFILCCICPVARSKGGLSFLEDEGIIGERFRDFVVGKPMCGFLYPAFNDRCSDIHNVLYYAKNSSSIFPDIIDKVLGSIAPMTADIQQESFHRLIDAILGEDADYTTVSSVYDKLTELIAENADNPEPLMVSKCEFKRVFEASGVEEEQLTSFDDIYDEVVGARTDLAAENLVNKKIMNIVTPDVLIKVNRERADLIQTKIVDGRKCIVVAVDDRVEVDGFNVKIV